MKKSYLLMAAAATMFAACSETDFVQEVNTQQAIGFEGFAGKTTRAEIADVDALENVGFRVWGWKTGGDPSATSALWTDGEEVTYVEASSVWNYTNKKQWEVGYTYKFGAVAPKDVTTASFSEEGVYTITDATSGLASSVTDYLVAGVQDIAASDAKLVTLDFKHVMSKVSVEITGADNVTVNQIRVKGWNNGEGTYSSDAAQTWAITGTEKADYVTVCNEGLLYKATDELTISPLLIVPQTDVDLTFEFTYKIGDIEFGPKEIPVNDQVLSENQHTIYQFSVGAATIEFSAKMSTDWTVVPSSQSPIQN